MCTISVISTRGGYRLVHNRDERRTRAPGEPPTVRTVGGLRVVSPRDAAAGGTWIAAREDGLTLAIMNVNPDDAVPRGVRSRGLIVRDLADSGEADPADLVEALDLGQYSPFRLIVASREHGSVRSWTWRGQGVLESASVGPPACWATSGLGDSVVRARLPLFEEMVVAAPVAAAQDAFHRFTWPGRGPESVLMTRSDARTVSITTVEAGAVSVRMTYAEIAPGEGAPSVRPAEVITLR